MLDGLGPTFEFSDKHHADKPIQLDTNSLFLLVGFVVTKHHHAI